MGANSDIQWTDHTFNPWTGCTEISPGCDHCYAAAIAKRNTKVFGQWGNEPRKRTSEGYWRQPLKWDRVAVEHGRRVRVFCASMADVFDNQAPHEWRVDLWSLIHATPNLDWLLLTKRPQNIAKMLPADWGDGYRNVWLGTTVENQEQADRRISHLLDAPAAVHFLSVEPLLEPVRLEEWTDSSRKILGVPRVDWIIVGGESGPHARTMDERWAQNIRFLCEADDVPFFMKQLSEHDHPTLYADIQQFPPGLRKRQMPDSAQVRAFALAGSDAEATENGLMKRNGPDE